jgi:hypothetical protein
MTIKNLKIVKGILFLFTLTLLFLFTIQVNQRDNKVENNEFETEDVVTDENITSCERSVHIGFVHDLAYANSNPGEEDGDESGCDATSCINFSSCTVGSPCVYRITCDGCNCKFQKTDNGGTDRCGG